MHFVDNEDIFPKLTSPLVNSSRHGLLYSDDRFQLLLQSSLLLHELLFDPCVVHQIVMFMHVSRPELRGAAVFWLRARHLRSTTLVRSAFCF